MSRTTLFLLVGSTLAALGCGGGAGATGLYGGGGMGGGGGLTCTGATPVTLKVKNYLAWCNVSVAGDTATSASSQTVCVADGAVALAATPLAGFQLGATPWHHVDGDTGSGTLGTVTGNTSFVTKTVTGTGSACAWVCCETQPPYNGDCPTTDQCP